MHPEHYIPNPFPGSMGIIETLGAMPTRLRIVPTEDVPDFVSATADDAYPIKTPVRAELADGTLFAWIFHEFRDTPEGGDIILRVWWPDAAPEVFFEEHAQHFSVEFRRILLHTLDRA
jgi:hypothetical protein